MSEHSEKQLVREICKRIEARKGHWKENFDQIRKWRKFVKKGAPQDWEGLTINIVNRIVRDQVSALYARNPRTLFRRRPRLEFEIWDESPDSIQRAVQTLAAARDPQMMMTVNPQAVQQAEALLNDVIMGMGQRKVWDQIGRTAGLLYDYFRDEQMYGSRRLMKRLIRRGYVDSVGYIRPDFQRVTKHSPEVERRIMDMKARLDEVERRALAIEEDGIDSDTGEVEELRQMIAEMEAQEQIIIREGLTFEFPDSLAIIPDEGLTDLCGFEGCAEVTEEFIMRKDQVEATYGIRLDKYMPYNAAGVAQKGESGEYVCVWMNWNKTTGLVHTVCDGFDEFLTRDFSPPVYIERFWPWLAFVPNPSDDPDDPWPTSEVEKVAGPCHEINRAAEGLAEHRYANRPGTVGTSVISQNDARRINNRKANQHISLEMSPEDLEKAFMPFPTVGIDPNVYDISQSLQQIEFSTGVSEARFDAKARVSATASSISEANHSATIDSLRDELDDLNNQLARMGGQILMSEMSAAEVKRIIGPGAVWPEEDMMAIAEELHLETEFGSSGYPNQAQRVSTLRDLGQILLEIPGVKPERMVKLLMEAIDQNMDLTDFFDPEQLMSIRGMNAQQGVTAGGADNAPRAPGPASTEPAIVN